MIFLEGGRRHPRRRSLWCDVSTALEKTTVWFARQLLFFWIHFAVTLQRCACVVRPGVRPAAETDFKCWHVFFFFFQTFSTDRADSSTRTLTVIVGEQCCNVSTQALAVLRVGLSPHKRKHPNAIQKKGGRHVARRMHCGQRAESRYEQDGAVFQH